MRNGCWLLSAIVGISFPEIEAFSPEKRSAPTLAVTTKGFKAEKETFPVSRSAFLSTVASGGTLSFLTVATTEHASAFEGGVGGLGKTKPETGVKLFNAESVPVQNAAGIISAEINVNNNPVLLSFQSPWPLFTSQGIESRDLQGAESAFVQVVTDNIPKEEPLSKQSMKKVLLASVLAQQGKFGAYAAPTDVRLKETKDPTVFSVSFTTFTPGLRESDRQALVKYCIVGNSEKALILLITGTTALRYKKQEAVIQKVTDSFSAVAAPSSRLRLS